MGYKGKVVLAIYMYIDLSVFLHSKIQIHVCLNVMLNCEFNNKINLLDKLKDHIEESHQTAINPNRNKRLGMAQ